MLTSITCKFIVWLFSCFGRNGGSLVEELFRDINFFSLKLIELVGKRSKLLRSARVFHPPSHEDSLEPHRGVVAWDAFFVYPYGTRSCPESPLNGGGTGKVHSKTLLSSSFLQVRARTRTQCFLLCQVLLCLNV